MRARSLLMAACVGASLAVPAQAQTNAHCADKLVGTWLVTIYTGSGDNYVYASRALVTLHMGGTLSVVDSNQHQGVQGSSFSAQQGEWACSGLEGAMGTTLNFGFPGSQSIARSEWQFRYNDRRVSGIVGLYIYPGVKDVNPWQRGELPREFRFVGQRIGDQIRPLNMPIPR